MKRIAFALFALTLGCGAAEAAGIDNADLTFDCAHVRVPPMSAVSAVTGIDNFSHAYAAREMYVHQAQRLCRNPAVALVHFVPESTVRPIDSVAARWRSAPATRLQRWPT